MPENKPSKAPEIGSRRFWNQKTSRMSPYVAGEQPRDRSFVKLNTNENPYPPPDEVIAAIRDFPAERIRLYPDPSSHALRQKLAGYFGLSEGNIFVGNGSDEILALAFQAFFESRPGCSQSMAGLDRTRSQAYNSNPAECIAFADITYSFYPVYAQMYDIPYRLIRLDEDFTLPLAACLEPSAGLVLANPNAPTGLMAGLDIIAAIAASDRDRLILLDEAYVDFAEESAVPLLRDFDNILVVQTCSKSRSLAGLRVGYALGAPELIVGLERIRDSFNSYTLDCLAQAAAIAAFNAGEWFEQTRSCIIATRERTARSLAQMGFTVVPSSANFLFVRHAGRTGKNLYHALREMGILVRHFDLPRIADYIRITIGTDNEMDQLIAALADLLSADSASQRRHSPL